MNQRVIVGASAVVGVAVVVAVTRMGIGLSSDSATYLAAARNLAEGKGFTVPTQTGDDVAVTLFPPLFPAVLSLFARAGVDPAAGARWLHALLLAGNVGLVAALVDRYTGGSRRAVAVAAILPVASADVLRVHAMAWSEPLFIFFILLGVTALIRCLDRRSYPMLIASSVAFVLAWFTRYAASAVIAGAVASLLLLAPKGKRVRDALVFAAVAAAPLSLWALRNVMTAESMVVATGRGASRAPAFHPITVYTLEQALAAAGGWIVPLRSPSPALVALGVVVIGAVGAAFAAAVAGASPDRPAARLPHLLLTLGGAYAAGLVFSISFVDASTPIDERILTPLHLFAIVVLACLVGRVDQTGHRRVWARRWTAAAVAAAGVWAAVGAGAVVHASRDGLALAESAWRRSETIALVRALPRDLPVYSDFPEAIYLLANRPADLVPREIDPISRRPNRDYAAEMERLRRRVVRGNAVVVLFPSVQRWFVPTVGELRRALGIRPALRTEDGVVFGLE